VSCAETRASGLWGTRRKGRGGDGQRLARRGLLALLVLAFAAPLSAGAAGNNAVPSYLAPSLQRAASDAPDSPVGVIVQAASTSSARSALDRLGSVSGRLDVVNAATGTIKAGDLTQLADQPGLVITPDNPIFLDAAHQADGSYSSSELWPHAVGVDRYWGQTLATRSGAGTEAVRRSIRRRRSPSSTQESSLDAPTSATGSSRTST
jgi:hypothetical protein